MPYTEIANDLANSDHGLHSPLTPIDKIEQRLSALAGNPDLEERRLVVLMEGGSFNPVHMGHVETMQIAKAMLEAQGSIVLGGYFSPAHDEYVRGKLSAEALSAVHRLRLIEKAVLDSDWLMADAWESLGSEHWVDFKTVLPRLEHYLSMTVNSPRPIEVVYVVGSDGAERTRAFLSQGQCVCVQRPCFEDNFYQLAQEHRLSGTSRCLFASGQTLEISSTAIRQGHLSARADENWTGIFREFQRLSQIGRQAA